MRLWEVRSKENAPESHDKGVVENNEGKSPRNSMDLSLIVGLMSYSEETSGSKPFNQMPQPPLFSSTPNSSSSSQQNGVYSQLSSNNTCQVILSDSKTSTKQSNTLPSPKSCIDERFLEHDAYVVFSSLMGV